MTARECKSCQFLRSLYTRDLEAELKQYIGAMPDDVKVSEDVYALRLSVCSACVDCVSGVCRYCGCFVAARTVKKAMSCPKPSKMEW